MTPSERKALLFLAAVAALGVGVRAARSAGDVGAPPREARAALARQIAAVESARAAGRAGRKRRPGARADRDGAGRAAAPQRAPNDAPRADSSRRGAEIPVDLDVADSAAIERLPRIGPALARRVVADRDTHGAFGSLARLERVRGIGPKLARTLAPHVTFSGTPRLPDAEPDRAGRRVRPAP